MLSVHNHQPFTLVAGLNVLEEAETNHLVAQTLTKLTHTLGIPFVFKASFDKANRSDYRSYRGPGLEEGLASLDALKTEFGFPVVTDVHEPSQVAQVAEVVDMIQVPAFLSRQTDLLHEVAGANLPVLLKKMQMMSPNCALQARNKLLALGATDVILCERGTTFGYQNLVLDFQGVCEMKRQGAPIIVDVSHALQTPGSQGHATGGRGIDVESMARAAISLGVGGVFIECHPKPEEARCDGPCALPLPRLPELLNQLVAIDQVVKASSLSVS